MIPLRKELILPERPKLLAPSRRIIRPRDTRFPIGVTQQTAQSVPGSQYFTTAGTHSFNVPLYTTLTVDVRGTAGSGGGYDFQYHYNLAWYYGSNGGDGGYSYFNPAFGLLIAYGGAGGTRGITDVLGEELGTLGHYYNHTPGSNGAHGTASGGTTNTTGGGTTGGAGSAFVIPSPYPSNPDTGTKYSGSGGNGGRAVRVYTPGQLTVGASVTVVVGALGARGTETYYGGSYYGAYGALGGVYISWT